MASAALPASPATPDAPASDPVAATADFPALTEFEAKLFAVFAKRHKPGYASHAYQLEGDRQVHRIAAAQRLLKKGVLMKSRSCRWYLTDLGEKMAGEWQKTQPKPESQP